jgi:hypothetical protein
MCYYHNFSWVSPLAENMKLNVTISITNRCDFCCMSLFHISLLTLHVSGLHRPIIRGISSCCLYATIWFMQCLLIVCVRLRTGLRRWLYCTVDTCMHIYIYGCVYIHKWVFVCSYTYSQGPVFKQNMTVKCKPITLSAVLHYLTFKRSMLHR